MRILYAERDTELYESPLPTAPVIQMIRRGEAVVDAETGIGMGWLDVDVTGDRGFVAEADFSEMMPVMAPPPARPVPIPATTVPPAPAPAPIPAPAPVTRRPPVTPASSNNVLQWILAFVLISALACILLLVGIYIYQNWPGTASAVESSQQVQDEVEKAQADAEAAIAEAEAAQANAEAEAEKAKKEAEEAKAAVDATALAEAEKAIEEAEAAQANAEAEAEKAKKEAEEAKAAAEAAANDNSGDTRPADNSNDNSAGTADYNEEGYRGPTTADAKVATGVDVQRLTTEPSAFVRRIYPSTEKVRCQDGYVCTLTVKEGQEYNNYVYIGDGTWYPNTAAGTYRFIEGYEDQSDAVHGDPPCLLVQQEDENGAKEVPTFSVYPGNFSCGETQKPAEKTSEVPSVTYQEEEEEAAPDVAPTFAGMATKKLSDGGFKFEASSPKTGKVPEGFWALYDSDQGAKKAQSGVEITTAAATFYLNGK